MHPRQGRRGKFANIFLMLRSSDRMAASRQTRGCGERIARSPLPMAGQGARGSRSEQQSTVFTFWNGASHRIASLERSDFIAQGCPACSRSAASPYRLARCRHSSLTDPASIVNQHLKLIHRLDFFTRPRPRPVLRRHRKKATTHHQRRTTVRRQGQL